MGVGYLQVTALEDRSQMVGLGVIKEIISPRRLSLNYHIN